MKLSYSPCQHCFLCKFCKLLHLKRTSVYITPRPDTVPPFSLRCHSANSLLCTHVNLKEFWSVRFSLWTPRTIASGSIQSAVVCLVVLIEKWTCRHFFIWYLVIIRYTYSLTNLKQNDNSNKLRSIKEGSWLLQYYYKNNKLNKVHFKNGIIDK